jgi:D-arabinose 1-dehydrogenase-like Zn-dependent alcohol dehydrogenase
MPLKPLDQRNPDETREAVWQAIRDTRGKGDEPNGTFTSLSIWTVTGASRATITEYLTGLQRAGYIAIVGESKPGTGNIKLNVYQLVRDAGIEAPRVRRDGTPVSMGRGRENMWRTMRIIGEFTARELAIAAATDDTAISHDDAQTYCTALQRAGYLVIIGERKLSTSSPGPGATRYRLIPSRVTGPKPPQVQRVKRVYDPNIRKVVWTGGAE